MDEDKKSDELFWAEVPWGSWLRTVGIVLLAGFVTLALVVGYTVLAKVARQAFSATAWEVWFYTSYLSVGTLVFLGLKKMRRHGYNDSVQSALILSVFWYFLFSIGPLIAVGYMLWSKPMLSLTGRWRFKAIGTAVQRWWDS